MGDHPLLTCPSPLNLPCPPRSLLQAAQLASHPAWQRSGFESLERFIFQFLTGGAGAGSGSSNGASVGGRAGAESVRLKLEVGARAGGLLCVVYCSVVAWEGAQPGSLLTCLAHAPFTSVPPTSHPAAAAPGGLRPELHSLAEQTWRCLAKPRCVSLHPCLQSPLFVADALLSAAETQLGQELAVARADAESVRLVRSQLAAFRRDMEKEGQLQVRLSDCVVCAVHFGCWAIAAGGAPARNGEGGAAAGGLQAASFDLAMQWRRPVPVLGGCCWRCFGQGMDELST